MGMHHVALLLCLSAVGAMAGDPYVFLDWNVTYGTIAPLGIAKEGILINGQFPGPKINCTTNNNIVINVFNNLDEPLLLTWSGMQQRKNSWQDGTPMTMCPIQPGTNYTYSFQAKDQIGTYFYFPTTGLQRAGGAFGIIQIHSRPQIPVPFDRPADEVAIALGDWYNRGHKSLRDTLNIGGSIGKPDGIQINGRSDVVGGIKRKPLFTMEPNKTYRYRICNVGMKTSINFRFEGHTMKLVELEGSHTVQNIYDSLDIHVGQCMSVLVTADQEPKNYHFVASSRFSKKMLTALAVIRYSNANGVVSSAKLPPPPPENQEGIVWSINQFRSFRWNLTASAARPNPQGSYHYGKIKIDRTIKIRNSYSTEHGGLRFGINNVSHEDTKTPIKLLEYFGKKPKSLVYDLAVTKKQVPGVQMVIAPSVVNVKFRQFVEIIFENHEKNVQTYHLDGYSFFAVAIEPGKWTPEKREYYNLEDAVSRNTIQVYPKSWAAIITTFDNAGLWNLRSDMQERFYLGQQLYFSVRAADVFPNKAEYDLPKAQILCGIFNEAHRPASPVLKQ